MVLTPAQVTARCNVPHCSSFTCCCLNCTKCSMRCCHADMLPAKDALHINRIAAFLGHLAVAAEVKAEGDRAKELPLQVGVGGAWEARS